MAIGTYWEVMKREINCITKEIPMVTISGPNHQSYPANWTGDKGWIRPLAHGSRPNPNALVLFKNHSITRTALRALTVTCIVTQYKCKMTNIPGDLEPQSLEMHVSNDWMLKGFFKNIDQPNKLFLLDKMLLLRFLLYSHCTDQSGVKYLVGL